MPRIKIKGQGGQSLAEFVLCLPVLGLMVFGMIQLALLGMVLAFSHYAASCALRSYTVFYPQGRSLAMQKAGEAMTLAMAWCQPMPDMDLEVSAESPSEGALAKSSYSGKSPLLFNAKLTAHVPLFFALAGKRSLDLHVQDSILSEKTVESD